MPTNAQSVDQVPEGNFVFQGTVIKLEAVTMSQVPVSDRTVVVRVDRLLQSPEALSDYTGREITVQLPPGQNVQVGQSLIFHTNGWIFGESLAVQSVKQEAASPAAVALLSSHPEDPVESLNTREAKKQAAAADLIVSGHVSAVRLSQAENQARASATTGGGTTERISEHAPLWQEAVVSVDAVHKGDHSKKEVVVRFPASTDVRWRNAPKFHTGQEGVFLLHKSQQAASAPALAAQPLGDNEYTALNAADFQPTEDLPHILG
jgi:hypothetical protein